MTQQMIEYRRYVQAEQAANKHRVEALRLREEVARERQRADLIASVYELAAAQEKQKQEDEKLRQLKEDAIVQRALFMADMALLRHQVMEAQQRKRPLINR